MREGQREKERERRGERENETVHVTVTDVLPPETARVYKSDSNPPRNTLRRTRYLYKATYLSQIARVQLTSYAGHVREGRKKREREKEGWRTGEYPLQFKFQNRPPRRKRASKNPTCCVKSVDRWVSVRAIVYDLCIIIPFFSFSSFFSFWQDSVYFGWKKGRKNCECTLNISIVSLKPFGKKKI